MKATKKKKRIQPRFVPNKKQINTSFKILACITVEIYLFPLIDCKKKTDKLQRNDIAEKNFRVR